MKIKYLGTAAAEGLPALFCNCRNCAKARRLGGKNIRTRSQALLGDDMLIDFGPDTYMHALRHHIDLTMIRDVLITHCHQDHFYIDDLLTRAVPFGNVTDTMNVYGNDTLRALYDHHVDAEGIRNNTDKVLRVTELKEYQTIAIGAYEVIPLPADHNPEEKCYIYIIRREGKTLLYANDTGYFSEEVWEFLKDFRFDLVSLDCNHIEMPIFNNHMSIPCCSKVSDRLADMNCIDGRSRCVLTHFSHNHGGIQEELEAMVEGMGFLIAYDGMELSTS